MPIQATDTADPECERKQVTVLFADIRGSLELLDGRDPEEARAILDPALQIMVDAVRQYDGTVNNLMGDGVMAIFGAPVALEEHALRACYAALALQSRMRSYNDQLRPRYGVEIQARVGLNSGEVVVRSIRQGETVDYAAIGQTTHLAARMEQLAAPGTIRLTEATYRLVEDFVQAEPLGPIPVRGLREPISIYQLIGAELHRKRLRTGPRGLTPFVGRRAEMETLRRASDAAASGRGQMVSLVGEPGVGKSRLVLEFLQSDALDGWKILEGASSSYGTATAYFPVIELLKTYFRVEPRDDIATVREKVTGKLVTLDDSLRQTLPAFFSLLHLFVGDSEWEMLDREQRRHRIVDAFKRFLAVETQKQPICVVFEDLHWIDAETNSLLNELTNSLATVRLLLIVTYRPEYRHDWGGRSSFAQLRVAPLAPQSAEELLQSLLGTAPELQSLKVLLIRQTEGNPFFLEESVRSLNETGGLTGPRGAHRLTTPLSELRVPATVQAVLAARIDRLEPAEKRLLQSAAVIGRDIPFQLLQAIAELPEDVTRRGLMRLQAAEFLHERSLFPDLEYTFRHALTAEVAYDSLLHDRRRAMHKRILNAMETLYAERLDDVVERMAHHAEKAEAWEQASKYLHRAGCRVASRYAHDDATRLFERALSALAHRDESRDVLSQGIDIRLDLRSSLVPLGELDRIFERLREAELLAERLEDPSRLGRVSAHLAHCYWLQAEYDRAIEAAERAREIAVRTRNSKLEIAAAFHLGQAYFNLADYRRAAEFNLGILEKLESEGAAARTGALVVLSHTWLVWSLAELGDFAAADRRAEAGLRGAEARGDPSMLTHAYIGLGSLALRKLNPESAARHLEGALELSRRYEFRGFLILVVPMLGYAYALSGRLREGISLLEDAVKQTEATKLLAAQSLQLTWLAEAYLLAGRVDEAAERAARAVSLAHLRRERGCEGWALRLQGELARSTRPADVGASAEAFSAALELAEQLGMQPLAAQCHLGLAACEERDASETDGLTHAAAAEALLRNMRLTKLSKSTVTAET